MRLAFISFLFMFISCTNDPHLVSELFEDKKLPIEIIEKSNLIHTENGLIKLEIIEFKKDEQDTRVKHVFLNDKGKMIFNEIFQIQKKRIYNALLNSKSEEVLNFDSVLNKITNG